MDSWWELGEGAGYYGTQLSVNRITCAFCGEQGHFSMAYHAEKKKPGSQKRLNFDVYKCGNCAGFVQVLWSAAEFGGLTGLHNFHVLPWPLSGKRTPSENWPEGASRFWIQAHDSLKNENWDAANMMARSSLQFVVRDKGAKKGSLADQIDELATQGVLHPLMQDWSHEVRLLANESAHPAVPVPTTPAPEDVKAIVNFLDFLLFYLYDLPAQIGQLRKRKEPTEE